MPPTTYATPGVYIEEIATLPPSIAEIGTAVPAFIGATGNHAQKGSVAVHEIHSLREFEETCGRGPASPWTVSFDPTEQTFFIKELKDQPIQGFSAPSCLLGYAIDHYFRNGGSRCYVVSIGMATPDASFGAEDFIRGLKVLERYDEPTLVVLPEAIKLAAADYGEVCQAALSHAETMKDRFVLLDGQASGAKGLQSSELEAMRSPLGINHLDRGAMFYPHLLTTLVHRVDEATIQVSGLPAAPPSANSAATEPSKPAAADGETPAKPSKKEMPPSVTLQSLATTQTIYYNQIRKLLAEQRVVLPPCAAIAGVIASVDRERGVWKAPANVSLQAVVAPVVQLTDEQQGLLNIDPTTGKSINAIRGFAGKGTLVWGARTLAGNDNEWRYISVRRLFITVEESVKKATAFAVFEANDTSTWLKVKGMIDSYLYTLWEKGALRGSKSEDAYFVNVGLNKTMTMDDILNGRLIVEIGLAAVRPAEFIILRFSHKLA
jgi:phage tail sheath protein FI